MCLYKISTQYIVPFALTGDRWFDSINIHARAGGRLKKDLQKRFTKKIYKGKRKLRQSTFSKLEKGCGNYVSCN